MTPAKPVLVITTPPVCPLGHGPMQLLKTELNPLFAPRQTEEFKCTLCSCQILRPVPDHEL